MALVKSLAYGSLASTYILIVIGGYVSATRSGLACPDWPLCQGQLIPPLSGPVLIEYTHRLFTLFVSAFILGTMLVAWIAHRTARAVVAFSTITFLLLVAQVLLGMVTVTSELNPVVSTAHLGLATAVFGFVLATAFSVRNLRRARS